MTKDEFRKAVQLQRLRGTATINACRLVLVDGMTQYAAAQKARVDKSLVSRAVKRLLSNVCPCCKRPL